MNKKNFVNKNKLNKLLQKSYKTKHFLYFVPQFVKKPFYLDFDFLMIKKISAALAKALGAVKL